MTTDPSLQLTNAGDDVVVFYNDKASLATLLEMMTAARDGVEENSPLMYHISLVDLLAACAEGKNVYTEIKCTSLLPLEDVVRVVTHEDCITEVQGAQRGACQWLCTDCCLLMVPVPRFPPSPAGEDGLRELCQPLLRGHRGGDEGDLHQQPHLDSL